MQRALALLIVLGLMLVAVIVGASAAATDSQRQPALSSPPMQGASFVQDPLELQHAAEARHVALVAAETHWYAVAYLNEMRDGFIAIDAANWKALAVRHTYTTPHHTVQGPPVYYNGNTGSVGACVKGAESGNYSESSHIGAGSGAYQYIPGTWRTWSMKAGFVTYDAKGNAFPTYSYAFQAPPAAQDSTFNYTISNGGAGNWSNRYGNDNCTAGLPGGG